MSLKRRIPNFLTFLRVAAVPASLIIIVFQPQMTMALFVIFLVASLTDFFDGYLARKWNAVTPLGTLLDPIADKLLVALMLVYLLVVMGTQVLLPVSIILLRELYISGLREFLAARNVALPVSKGGKLKTALQMAAITLLLGKLAFNPPHEINFPCALVQHHGELTTSCINQPLLLRAADLAGMPLLHAAALVALLTGLHYTWASRKSWK